MDGSSVPMSSLRSLAHCLIFLMEQRRYNGYLFDESDSYWKTLPQRYRNIALTCLPMAISQCKANYCENICLKVSAFLLVVRSLSTEMIILQKHLIPIEGSTR